MTFKRRVWFPIAVVVVVINVAGGIYAYLGAELSELERELMETREKLDFADQLLKNKPPSS